MIRILDSPACHSNVLLTELSEHAGRYKVRSIREEPEKQILRQVQTDRSPVTVIVSTAVLMG